MKRAQWWPIRRLALWGVIGFFALIGISIAVSLAFFASRPVGTLYPFYPFGWFWGLLWIFLFFWIARWFFWPWRWYHGGPYWRYRDEAYDILRERYARGEITKDQFDQMMRDLSQHG